MKTYYYVIILLLLCVYTSTQAQNIATSTFEWQSTSTFLALSGENINERTKVVSSSTTIEWYDGEDSVRHAFVVNGIEGSWTNIFDNGSAIFKVSSNGSSGIIQFLRFDGKLRVRIQIVRDEDSLIYELIVNDVKSH